MPHSLGQRRKKYSRISKGIQELVKAAVNDILLGRTVRHFGR